MLDKLKLNNLIISNAKIIQKVRIQIVRKIIQRMRKLKMLLEKRSGDESSIVKLRKCVAIVDVVKKMKREDVIRNILLLEKSPSKIVTNSQSKPDEVAVALMAANKTMKDLIERFRQELNYNDEEAENWKKTLIEIGKLKAKKQRRKKRAAHEEKKSKKNSKETLLKSRNENSETMTTGEEKVSFEAGTDTSEDESAITTVNQDKANRKTKKTKIERLENTTIKKTKIRELEETSEDSDISTQETNVRELEETSEDEDEQPPKNKKAKMLKKTTNDNKSSKKMKVKELDETFEGVEIPINRSKVRKLEHTFEEDNEQNNRPAEPKKQTSTQQPKAESQYKFLSGYEKFEVLPNKPKETLVKKSTAPVKVGVVDPFFITATGEPYIANIVLKPGSSEDTDSMSKPQSDFGINPRKYRSGEMETSKNPKFRSNNMEDKQNHQELHSSWLAKKKLNSIAEFRGKKIVFDETGSTSKSVSHNNNKAEAKTDLHPSWAAKQKMKPTITAFQGKKITFGDEE